jgi:DNA-binding transcriptional LysR family regulator
MVPTQHGESLLAPAKRILDETENLFLKKHLSCHRKRRAPSTSPRPTIWTASSCPTGGPAAPRLAQQPRENPQPGAGVDYVRLLSDGDMDLVIANWDEPPAHLHMSKLFEDPIICVMRADCPYALRTASDAMTMDDYLTLPHVAPTQILPGYHGVIDAFLERQGLQRNVVVESAYFGLIPYMLAQTDLVLTTGSQFVRFYERACR